MIEIIYFFSVKPTGSSEEFREVDPLKIIELKRGHVSQIILEEKPVCPGDEEPTKPSEEEKLVCPGDEEPTKPSTSVKLVEVIKNKGEVTISKEKSKKKKWNPFKKSHKVIEKRREQQIVEYGDEEPTKLSEEEKPVCPGNEEPTEPSEEEKPVCPRDDETTMVFEEEKPTKVSENLTRTKNHLRVVSLSMKSFFLSFILAVIIFVGVKVAFPDVDLQMIGGMSMIGFSVSLLVQQLFNLNNSCQCHVLSGEECTCHTLSMKSFFLSFILAVIIFVGVKVAFPDVDLQMIGGMSMIGFSVSLLVQQL